VAFLTPRYFDELLQIAMLYFCTPNKKQTSARATATAANGAQHPIITP